MPICRHFFFTVFNVFFSHCKALLNIAEWALYKYFIIYYLFNLNKTWYYCSSTVYSNLNQLSSSIHFVSSSFK